MTHNGSTRCRCRRSASSRGGCWPSRSPWSSPPATPAPTRWPGCRNCRATACPTPMRASCWTRSCWAASTNGCATASSPRRAAIPLALLEVPRNVSAARTRRRLRRSAGAPIGGPDRGRLHAPHPVATRRRPIGCCSSPRPSRSATRRCFCARPRSWASPVDALAPAEAAGVIEFGPRMRFHHPLMRSAAYRAADLTDRRAIHRALADATDAALDPDRRAWHAANAAAGPDDAVAAELEASAGRAQSRGGIAAAAAFLERAADADRGSRAARVPGRSRPHRPNGTRRRPRRPTNCWRSPNSAPLSELQRAQAARLRAQMEFARSRGGDPGAPRLGEAAAQLLDGRQADSRTSTTTWPGRRTSRRSPPRCTPGDSARRAR